MATTFTEGRHAAEFVLTEGPGHLSRDTVTIAENQTIEVGALIVNGAGGYVAYAAGGVAPDPATGIGIALYPVTTGADETLKISAITRAAEVNGHRLAWPDGITAQQMTDAAAILAANMVIVRGFPAA